MYMFRETLVCLAILVCKAHLDHLDNLSWYVYT